MSATTRKHSFREEARSGGEDEGEDDTSWVRVEDQDQVLHFKFLDNYFLPVSAQQQHGQDDEDIFFNQSDAGQEIDLLSGECVEWESVRDSVQFRQDGRSNNGGIWGTLTLTSYRICFAPNVQQGSWRLQTHFEFPLGNLHATSLQQRRITMQCLDYRQDLTFFLDDGAAAVQVHHYIQACIANNNSNTTHAFALMPTAMRMEADVTKLRAALEEPAWQSSSVAMLRKTEVNKHFALTRTYPPTLIVPACMTDAELLRCARFRLECRIPTMSWISSSSQASIWRSAQPLIGIRGTRSDADEKLVRGMAPSVLILDCRAYSAAFVNKMGRGGGTESVTRYVNAEVLFADISNQHQVRHARERLASALNNIGEGTSSSMIDLSASALFFAPFHQEQETTATAGIEAESEDAAETSAWLHHIRSLLSAAMRVVQAVRCGRGVLVHCTHGWDRTPQVVCLAVLLLDSRARTLRGFVQLIHREWIQFGHQFATRVRGGAGGGGEERSPIFYQFLDCVQQLIRLFPSRFEFNTRVLECLAHHTTSRRFVEFLGRGAADWDEAIASCAAGASIWNMLLFDERSRETFLNFQYKPETRGTGSDGEAILLSAGILSKRLELWDYYLRHAGSACHADHAQTQHGAGRWEWWM